MKRSRLCRVPTFFNSDIQMAPRGGGELNHLHVTFFCMKQICFFPNKFVVYVFHDFQSIFIKMFINKDKYCLYFSDNEPQQFRHNIHGACL
jgi:hypothetical protein